MNTNKAIMTMLEMAKSDFEIKDVAHCVKLMMALRTVTDFVEEKRKITNAYFAIWGGEMYDDDTLTVRNVGKSQTRVYSPKEALQYVGDDAFSAMTVSTPRLEALVNKKIQKEAIPFDDVEKLRASAKMKERDPYVRMTFKK